MSVPVTAIRYLNTGKTIKGYGAGGVSAGIVDIKGEAWRPYQPTTSQRRHSLNTHPVIVPSVLQVPKC